MNSRKRILIAPLNWGLGHATRVIPIINKLIELGQEVIIGANGASKELLKREFPELEHIKIPGYDFQYGSGNNQIIAVLKQLPAFIKSIKNEQRQLQQLIELYKLDIVISDNRYGLWSNKIPTVLITHQLFIKAPAPFKFLEPLIKKGHFYFINRFSQCWIPDLPDKDMNLSGELSHNKNSLPVNFKYIGLLSRFQKHIKKGNSEFIAGIVSGPEPQRTIFEELLIDQLSATELRSVIVSGAKKETSRIIKNVEIMPLSSSQELKDIFQEGPIVISRCGYSSLMDYIALGINSLVIPTPGQTEQEYLAERLMNNGWCYSQSQQDLNIKKGIDELEKYKFPDALSSKNNLLEEAIIDLVNN